MTDDQATDEQTSPLLAIQDAAHRVAVLGETIPWPDEDALGGWRDYYEAVHELLVTIMGPPTWHWRQPEDMIAQRKKVK